MKAIKHILALCLSIVMIASMIVSSGVMTASAIAGGGVASSTYRAYGADLSFWNVGGSTLNYSLVDFAKMKADGCQFVILRLGYEGSSSRTDVLDTAFVEFYNRARAAGMPLGVYFYSLATTYAGAQQDANWVADQIEKYGMYFEYPIYYDIEDSTYTNQVGLSSTKMEQLCLGWCETLEARGYFPGIYGGKSQVLDKLSSSFKSKYDLWYPRVLTNGHGSQYNPANYDYSYMCNMWQYAWYDYEYNGIGLDMLDVNVCYKNYPAIMAQYGYNNCGNPAKTNLGNAIDEAKKVRYDYYTESNLSTLRSVYNEAVALYNNESASDDSMASMATKLENAVKNTVANAESVVSKGKSYTTTESGRTDIYVDDGKRLTDGVKGNTDGGNNMFSGYNSSSTIDVVLDMGGNVNTNTYRIYAAKMESWGISAPAKLEISVSNDGVNFTNVGSTSVRYRTSGTTDTWNMFTYTVKTNTTRTERYIKFTVTSASNHVWLEEVEAISAPVAATGKVYVTGVNKYITAGDTVVFTPGQEINVTNFNISYTTNVVATWNGANYVVSSVTTGTGTDTPAITLNSNQILVACHEWESGTDDPILGSGANSNRIKSVKVGDVLTLTNVDVANKSASVTPTIQIVAASSEPVEKPANAEVFWVTHINDHNSEGAGSIFTSAYEGAVWWLHVAFAPTGTAGVYKITAISDGIPEGKGEAQAIPEGGFVYAINKGNNYIELGIGDTDFTSPNCDAAIAQAQTWKVGDEFKFYGIDPLNPTVSTSTPGLVWYEDNYVCTSYFERLTDDEPIVTPPVVEPDDVVLGDVNLDGKIDQYDYILVKRHYFETRILVGDEFKRGDVNVDGVVDQYDYILIARHYFGTFVIAQD